jgi:secretion/DNA translocation related TadE-like protein
VSPRHLCGGPARPAGRAAPARRRDEGGASVWLLAVGLVLLAAGLVGASLGAAYVAAHQARTAADLGALAGAAQAVYGQVVACERARAVVAANDARLVECEVTGLDLVVVVEVTPVLDAGLARPATATARAGPIRADDSGAAPGA